MSKQPDELKILCPFCNAPYTAEMIEELFGAAGACDTCGDFDIWGEIKIVCVNCKKIVYRKEIKRQ